MADKYHLILTAVLWLLAAVFGVCCLVFSCFSGRWRRRLWLELPLTLVCAGATVRCHAGMLSLYSPVYGGAPVPAPDPFLLPLWATALCTGAAVLLQLVLLLWDKRTRKPEITRLSVQESFEALPVALCFSDDNGRPILVNRKMAALSFELQHRALLNADAFWNALPAQTVHTADGGVWTLQRSEIQTRDGTVRQIVAIPIGDLDRLRGELQAQNDALLKNNRRLLQYGREVEALTREREIFSAKSRLHNELGSVLLTTQYALLHTQDLPVKSLLEQWKRVLSMIEQQKLPDQPQEDLFDQFKQAARSVDVRIVLQGILPADPQVRRLIVAVGKQALTNAVRHANATRLTLQIDDRADGYTVRYTNDGDPPQGEIIPGGGLSEARTLAEGAGGWLSIESDPVFRLTMFIPYEGGDGDVPRDGGGRPGDGEKAL